MNKLDNNNMLEISNQKKEIEVKKCLLDLEKQLKRKIFCIIQNSNEEIDYALYYRICDSLDNLKQNADEYFKNIIKIENNQDLPISILISSYDGDIDAAYKIINTFYQITNDVEIIVIDIAKSAATFICLGAKKIYMSRSAELGPLDAQIPDPSGFSETKSALNAFKSLESLRQYTVETLNQIVILLMKKAGMEIPYALKHARYFVSDIVNPLYSQINPMELGDSRRKLAVAERYSKIIMKRYGYSDFPQEKIDSIVNTLVWEYPSHSFVIDIKEALSLDLKVGLLDDKLAKICDEIMMESNGCLGFLNLKREDELNEKEKTSK